MSGRDAAHKKKNLQEALRATSAVIRRRESVMVSSFPIPEPWASIPKKKEEKKEIKLFKR